MTDPAVFYMVPIYAALMLLILAGIGYGLMRFFCALAKMGCLGE